MVMVWCGGGMVMGVCCDGGGVCSARRVSDARDILHEEEWLDVRPQLQELLRDTPAANVSWDVIIVDGPDGVRPTDTGERRWCLSGLPSLSLSLSRARCAFRLFLVRWAQWPRSL